jgi:uncharacterized protein YebE (UPF0316 family)
MITPEILLGAALLFTLRVLNNAIGTVRLITLSRQRRTITFILSFFESLIFAVTIAVVVTDLTNLINLTAYCTGFAVGSWVGMVLEARLITSYMIVNIFAAQKGHEIAVAVRERGFGITETVGKGRDGDVIMLRSVVQKRDLNRLLEVIHSQNENAFIAVEEARSVERGWLGLRTRSADV